MTNNDATTVIGRNGFEYPATYLCAGRYIVGKFIVTVADGKCDETLCRATKKNIARMLISCQANA